jgi:hypothetical protein
MKNYIADFHLKIKKFQLLLSPDSTEDSCTYRSLGLSGGVSIHISALRMGTAMTPGTAHEQSPSRFSPQASCKTKSKQKLKYSLPVN